MIGTIEKGIKRLQVLAQSELYLSGVKVIISKTRVCFLFWKLNGRSRIGYIAFEYFFSGYMFARVMFLAVRSLARLYTGETFGLK